MWTIRSGVVLAVIAGVAAGDPPSLHTLAQQDAWWRPSDPSAAAPSADGRYVAFVSYARLAAADTNDRRDVYVLDRTNGRVTLESVTAAGEATVVDSTHPRLSRDGRFLVYETVVPTIGRSWPDIVLRDRLDGTSRIITAAADGGQSNGFSRAPAISSDGEVIAFSSSATNLVPGTDANGLGEDVYVLQRVTGAIARISLKEGGVQTSAGASMAPSLSGDGRYVAFASTAPLDGGEPDPATPHLSQIYVYDRARNHTTRVTAFPGHVPDGSSWAPAISADGRHVAFVSAATNLVPPDRNRSPDVFVAARDTGEIELVSRRAGGASTASGESGSPAVSADGRFVAFQSEASDILCARRCTPATEDINLLWDVFLLDRHRRVVARLSADRRGGWMAPSGGPALDGTAELVVFSSRHPTDGSDTKNDYDLFLSAAPSRAAGVSLLRERADGFHHRHEPHAFAHRDVLPEYPFDDAGVDRGNVRWW